MCALALPSRTQAARIASPYENYTRRDERRDAQFFQNLVGEEDVVGFVIGLPLHTSGQESKKSQEARQFAVLAGGRHRPPHVLL